MTKKNPDLDAIGRRALLRLLIEFGSNLDALVKIEGDTDLVYILSLPTVQAATREALIAAADIAQSIGSKEDVEAYLSKYREEDKAFFAHTRDSYLSEKIERIKDEADAFIQGGVPCADCGEGTCQGCGECHHCDGSIAEAKRKAEGPKPVLN